VVASGLAVRRIELVVISPTSVGPIWVPSFDTLQKHSLAFSSGIVQIADQAAARCDHLLRGATAATSRGERVDTLISTVFFGVGIRAHGFFRASADGCYGFAIGSRNFTALSG